MATLTDLVKTIDYVKLSEKEEKTLEKTRKSSIKELEKFKEIQELISSSLKNDGLKDIESAEDLGRMRSKIYEALYNKFSEAINAYGIYLLNLKRKGYFIPNLSDNIPCLTKIDVVTDFRDNYSWRGKTKSVTTTKTKEGSWPWMSGFNDYKKFDYKNLVSLMEKLGFVIMPLEFLSDEAFKVDTKFTPNQIKEKVESFKTSIKNIESGYDYYILAPIKYLDLMKWAKCKDISKTVTFASSLGSVSLNINMNMPLFRSIFGTMEMLEKRVSNVEGKVDIIKEELDRVKEQQKLISDNVNNLQSQLNHVQTEMISKINSLTLGQDNLNKRVKSLEAWRIACMTDPLIFAKKGESCYIGFSWGPEFSGDILKEFGIPVYK